MAERLSSRDLCADFFARCQGACVTGYEMNILSLDGRFGGVYVHGAVYAIDDSSVADLSAGLSIKGVCGRG